MRTFYGKVTAPASERAMLESLGVEVAPLRAEDGESFLVATDDTGRQRLAELVTDFPHVLHTRSRDIDGPLSVVVMTAAERAGETAWLDFLEARPALRRPAWFARQRDALAGQHAGHSLPREQVQAILAAHGETADPKRVMHYTDLGLLAEVVRGAKHWGQGEIFVCAIDDARFVIMKQIAPASCEMLTLTHHGYHDVLTAYRYEQDALIAALRDYLQVEPEAAPRYEQPPGHTLGGFVVGHAATRAGNPTPGTIVGLDTHDGRVQVTVHYAAPQLVDSHPRSARSTRFVEDARHISATWPPAPGTRVLPEIAPFRDGVLLKAGTTVALKDAEGVAPRIGIVSKDFTVADRAVGTRLTLQPATPDGEPVTCSEDELARIEKPAPGADAFARRAAHTYRVAVLTVSPEGEQGPLGVVFARGASIGDAQNRAYDRLWTPALRAARLQPAYQTEAVPRYVHGSWKLRLAEAPGENQLARFVYDRQSETVSHVQMRNGARWGKATPAQVEGVRADLVDRHPEALFGPAVWDLLESETPPAWMREAAPAPRVPASELTP